MDEFKKRALDNPMREESSLLNVQKRKMMELYESTQGRAARDALSTMSQVQRSTIDRILEENKRVAQSFGGLHFPTASDALIETVKHIGLLERRRLHDYAFPKVSSVVAETVRHITRSEEFKIAQFTAAKAVANTLRVSQDYQRGIPSNLVEMHRRVAAESVASLSALINQQFKVFEDVQSTFARSIVQEIREALADFERRQEVSIEELEESLTQKFDELPDKIKDPSWIRRLQFLAAVASILSLLIPLIQLATPKPDSKEDEEKLKTVIVALIAETIKKTERELTIFYVAERTVTLKEAPNHKSKTIMTIPKNDEVRLIQRKHKWIYIEYTQDSDEKPLYGWVDKKYLRLAAASR